jgi:uncharacterized protein
MRTFILIATLYIAGALMQEPSCALEVPEWPHAYVTDQANLLTPDTKAKLERALASYELQTTHQVLLVTLPSLEGDSLEDFSIRLAEAWKAGQKGQDNGVILLIFRDDRRMRIEVGYGLEGVLPDALAGQIINRLVVPNFKNGEFEKGILAGLQAIQRAIQGEFQNQLSSQQDYRRPLTPQEMEALRAKSKVIGAFVLGLVILFFAIDFFRYQGYIGSHRVHGDRYNFWEWWFRFAILLFVLNLVFRILFYSMLFSRGGYYGGRSGFRGFSGGGGSFGGGGASGGW